MGNLEIIYYVDIKSEEVLPLVKEKATANSGKFMLDTLNNMFAIFEPSMEKRQENKVTFLTGYYIDLLKKGYSCKEIELLLRDAFQEVQSFSAMESIMEQIEILKSAYKTFHEDKSVFGLSDFFMMPTIQKNVKEYHTRKLRR